MAGSAKPRVLVTGPDKRFKWGWWATRLCLFLVGLKAVYISPQRKRIPENVRGIIIGGGDDIEPEHYGLVGDAGAHYDRARDEMEMTILRKALSSTIPVLGICRGSQLINVVLGGNLHQDLRPKRNLTPNRNSIFPIKWALLEKKSKLYEILQCERIRINSLHNQAVNHLAEGLQVIARDEDTFVQAVEREGERFLLGVQWHPEYMPYSINQLKIFRAFARAVRNSNEKLDVDVLTTS